MTERPVEAERRRRRDCPLLSVYTGPEGRGYMWLAVDKPNENRDLAA